MENNENEIRELQSQIRKKNRMLMMSWASMFVMTILMALLLDIKDKEIYDQEDRIVTLTMNESVLTDSLETSNARLAEVYKLSWDNIDYWIDVFEIKHPEIVKAQIFEETANLTSNICISNHNLFGMRMPAVRETSALGSKGGFAYYGSYIESIQDYALWQQYNYTDDNEDYYSFLVRVGYCHPDGETYVRKVKHILEYALTSY